MDEKKPKYAHKVSISLVKSPTYPDIHPNFDEDLKLHFQTTQILKKNDYIFLKNIYDPSSHYQFKVIDVEPADLETFKIDTKNTSLSMLGPIKDNWIWLNKETSSKTCLNSYVHQIEKIIQFYNTFHQLNDNLPILLLHGPNGSGKTRSIQSVCQNLSLHLCKVNSVNLAGESASAVEKRIEIFLQNSVKHGPCVIQFQSSISRLKKQNSNFFIICTTNSKQSIDSSITSSFNHELQIKSLDDTQRKKFFSQEFSIENDQLEELTKKTNGLYLGEIQTLCDLIKQQDSKFDKALELFTLNRKFHQENKLNIDLIKWGDVGGLSDIKEVIIDTILLPLNYPHLFTSTDSQLGITRSGILLYGPPGTGKTLLAKAISNECGLNFLSVKGPELLDMYVGQTELNVRNLFEKARLNSPCILFFDELDSLAPIRGRAGDSGGVMDRVVSQLLTEIDGLDKYNSSSGEKVSQIFLIGATNRPDLIDASLLRPGRFDKLIYVPIAKGLAERVNIFKALIRKLPIDEEFDIEEFVEECPLSLSGADFYAITNRARQNAIRRLISGGEEVIVISKLDFYQALTGFQPTLSESALVEYENYFNSFSNKN